MCSSSADTAERLDEKSDQERLQEPLIRPIAKSVVRDNWIRIRMSPSDSQDNKA